MTARRTRAESAAELNGAIYMRLCELGWGCLVSPLREHLRRLADGDWIGNEEPATFTPYKKPRRCY